MADQGPLSILANEISAKLQEVLQTSSMGDHRGHVHVQVQVTVQVQPPSVPKSSGQKGSPPPQLSILPNTPSEQPPRRVKYSPEFEALWQIMPRGEKKKGYEQYRKAVPHRTTHAHLMDALLDYVAEVDEDRFRAHLFRWIRDDYWDKPIKRRPAHVGHTVSPGSAARYY